MRGTDEVAVCFFGDGATAQGLLYEAMNMAALWKLPVIYACENNGYSEYTPTSEIAAGSLTARAEAMGIEAFKVDGQNVLAVNALATQLVERARHGEGPFFIELETYRYMGHHVGDINRAYYRPKAEEEHWQTHRDPINQFGAWLSGQGIASDADLAAIRADILAEAEEAVAYALAAPFPEPEAVLRHVFAEQANA
jgi:pyruvate dehydrogenase E1 component alpha subunit